MSQWHGGKGSKPRPVDKKKFDDNWDRIFGKKQVKNDESEKKDLPNEKKVDILAKIEKNLYK